MTDTDNDYPFADVSEVVNEAKTELAETAKTEPAPEPRAEPAPTTKEQPKAPEQTQQHQTVPLATLMEERAERKRMGEQLAVTQRQVQEFQRRFQMLIDEANKPEPVPVPEFDADPAAHLKHGTDTLGRTVEDLARQIAELKGQTQQDQQSRQYQAHYESSTREFAAKTPDYGEAFKFAVEARDKQLAVFEADPQKRVQTIERELHNLNIQALNSRRNPAELVYNLAKVWGYTPKQADAAARLAAVANGQARASSLSSVGGDTAKGTPGLADIANMSDEEFNQLAASKGPAFWKKLLGPATAAA